MEITREGGSVLGGNQHNEVKTAETPIMVERVVADIDEIVRLVRFPGWQGTQVGEREVKKALRKALFKYKLHADEELFEKAYRGVSEFLCKRDGLQLTQIRSPNSMVNRFSAAFQSRIGMLHFWLMLRKAR